MRETLTDLIAKYEQTLRGKPTQDCPSCRGDCEIPDHDGGMESLCWTCMGTGSVLAETESEP